MLKYVEARATETEHALGWLKTQGGEAETRYREHEGKAVLLRLVGIMVENEGRLSGRCVALWLCCWQTPRDECNSDPRPLPALAVPRSRAKCALPYYPTSSPRRGRWA